MSKSRMAESGGTQDSRDCRFHAGLSKLLKIGGFYEDWEGRFCVPADFFPEQSGVGCEACRK